MNTETLLKKSPAELDVMPISDLVTLQMAADEQLAHAQQVQNVLYATFSRRFAQGLNATGTHHRREGGFDIKINIPKRVEWDQDELAKAADTLRNQWKEDPSEYIETKMTVPESKFKAWPKAISAVFLGARTVKPGKPKFEFSVSQEDAA